MTDPDDLKLLHELIAQGGSKYTAGNIDRRKYQRLVEPGWLKAFMTNARDVSYRVTERGQAAASRF